MISQSLDAIVVGSGPNGLAAAITLAREGWAVRAYEAGETVGGGMRSGEIGDGLTYDLCSAIHPLGAGSPCFRQWPLEEHGLRWIHPPLCAAHPLDGGRAAVLERSLDATVERLEEARRGDGKAWRGMVAGLAESWETLAPDLLRPMLRLPRHPLALAGFGARALLSARTLARLALRGDTARALFAGLAAHTMLPFNRAATSAPALVLGAAAHAGGWPFPAGGTQSLADALAAYLRALGGEIITGHPVTDLGELPPARAVLCDLAPAPFLRLAGERLSSAYRRKLRRFRYGPGVFKLDLVLDGPVPWAAADCGRAGTVHVGGTLEEVAAGEAAVNRGEVVERPFVLVAQNSLFDASRTRPGRQVLWTYCHAPSGSDVDMTDAIERQVERFAPGFRDRIVERRRTTAQGMEAYNPNYVGGDVGAGAGTLRQVLARPVLHPTPYRTPVPGLYLCSASTPPGGGVHGMCGYHAARAVLADHPKVRNGEGAGGGLSPGTSEAALGRSEPTRG